MDLCYPHLRRPKRHQKAPKHPKKTPFGPQMTLKTATLFGGSTLMIGTVVEIRLVQIYNIQKIKSIHTSHNQMIIKNILLAAHYEYIYIGYAIEIHAW